MTLPTSGKLTLNDIRIEFGGATPHALSEYYNGGPYVPVGTEGVNGVIPSSGQLAISDFYGAPLQAAAVEFTLSCGASAYDSGAFPTPAYPRGYTRVWGSPGDTYGSIVSGSLSSPDGWGMDTIAAYQELQITSAHNLGYTINFSGLDTGLYRFSLKFLYDDTSESFLSSAATQDSNVLVNYSGGTKTVRSLYYDWGVYPVDFMNKWTNGEHIEVTVEKL